MKIKLVAADVQVFHIGGGFIGEGCEVMSSWKDATFGGICIVKFLGCTFQNTQMTMILYISKGPRDVR